MIPLTGRAYLFIALNVARFLSILTLLLVFASTILTMVNDIHAIKRGNQSTPSVTHVNINGTEYFYDCDYLESSTVPLQPGGSMFAIINHIFIVFQCIVLVLSELSWPAWFFDDFLPVLGKDHGVAILGFLQVFLAAGVLSHHVETFALVSAFFLFAIGYINILLGIAFRKGIKSKRSLLSFKENMNKPTLPRSAADFRSAGGAAAGVLSAGGSIFTHMTGSSSNTMSEKPAGLGLAGGSGNGNGEHAGFGFGRQGEKQAGLKGFLISRPVESLPRYVPRPSAATRPSGSGTRQSSPSRATSVASHSSRASSRASSRDSVDELDRAPAAAKPNRI